MPPGNRRNIHLAFSNRWNRQQQKTFLIMEKLNCITINTDASFHPKHGVGGYAFWIVCNLFTIKKSGNFKVEPKTPEEAEIMCIGNAIATLIAQELPESNLLIINNDCKFGMDKIQNRTTPLSKSVYLLKNRLAKKLGGCKTEFRYVKAHNGTSDKRSFVNDWCDQEAKYRMRKWVGFKLVFDKKFPNIKVGAIVSHEDYSTEKFTVKSINYKTGIVETTVGKNRTWTNHAELIIV